MEFDPFAWVVNTLPDMSEKKPTPVILFSLLLTLGLGAIWWLSVWWFSNPNRETRAPRSPVASTSAPAPNSPGQARSGRFAQVQNVPTGLFSYGGSSVWEPLRLAIEPELQAARPEFRLRYVNFSATGNPSSAKGVNSLLNGQLAFSLSSRPLIDEEYQQAAQRSLSLTQIPVAIEGLAVVVHPALNLPGLTLEQLRDIYLGKVTNWQQLGGANLPITALSPDPTTGGMVNFFVEQVLGGQSFASSVQGGGTMLEAVRKVAQAPGAIYFGAALEVMAQCNVKPMPIGRTAALLVSPYEGALVTQCSEQRNRLNRAVFQSGEYPLARNLFVIVKQDKDRAQQAGEAYANLLLSDQGQAAIAKAGFLPIR